MYNSRLKKIWDELDNYMRLISTTSTVMLSLINKEREEEKGFQFLMGLNDNLWR